MERNERATNNHKYKKILLFKQEFERNCDLNILVLDMLKDDGERGCKSADESFAIKCNENEASR